MKKFWYTHKENPLRFWIQLTLISAVLWILTGVIGFLTLPDSVMTVLKILVGLWPCALLLFAVLALMEHKWKRTPLNEKAQKKAQQVEAIVLVLFGVLAVMAEVVYQYSDDISYALPLVLAALAGVAIVRISAPAIARRSLRKATGLESKLDSLEIVKVLIFGSFIAIVFTMFFRSASGVLMNL